MSLAAALSLLEPLLLVAYFVVLGLLAFYGLHRIFVVWLYRRSRHRAPGQPPGPEEWPLVTVQLPLFNERYVARRLLRAVEAIDYPRNRLEVQVLDDSTDDTVEIVAAEVERLRGRGLVVHHLRRPDRTGYKAGALTAGLEVARGELVCVFDADFVPPPEMLRRTVPHFRDPRVGMVQARWGHLNRDYSLLCQIQAIQLDAHFAVEHSARNRSGRFFNFNGTAGVWRRQTILDAGNWQHDTLTEDLDLSYRAQVRGWRFVYLDDLEAPAELPVEMSGFKSQRRRWTKGAVQTARKMLGRIWRSPASKRAKIEATFHLTANVSYPLNLALAVLVFPAVLVRLQADWGLFFMVDVPIFLVGTGSVCLYYYLAQRELGREALPTLARLPALMAIDMSISINNTVAVLEGFRSDAGEFVRTPKFSLVRGESWTDKLYRGRDTWLHWVELAAGLYFTVALAVASWLGLWPALPFLFLYQAGFLYTGASSLGQRWQRTSEDAALQRAPL